ncbi:MAG: TIGR02186 family protein [Hyphomicrobiaceae bacterium]
MRKRGTVQLTWRRRVYVALSLLLAVLLATETFAQRRQERATPMPAPPIVMPKAKEKQVAPPAAAQPPAPVPETVQADISTRRVAVTSSFAGTEIVVFGAVENSRQQTAEAGLYDIVIVVVGAPSRLVARKKSKIAGIWLNADSLEFLSVPSYYAIASTRPVDEIASDELLKAANIGFEHIPMVPSEKAAQRPVAEIKEFRDAVVRMRRKDKLFQQEQYSVAFIGRSLFRASIDVPANVTVGSFETRVFLFRNGELLSRYNARLNLEREGLEDKLHAFAFRYPLSYGIATVILALAAGLLASTLFRKGAH